MKNILNFKLIGTIIMCLSYIMFIGAAASMNDNVIDNLIIDIAAFIYVAVVSARWLTYDLWDDKIPTIGYIVRYAVMACFGILYTWWAVEGTVNMFIDISPLLTIIAALAIGICSICHLFVYIIYIMECNERHERDTKKEGKLCK